MVPNLGYQQQNQLSNKSQSDSPQVESYHSPLVDESDSDNTKPFSDGSQNGNMHIGYLILPSYVFLILVYILNYRYCYEWVDQKEENQ